MARDVTLEIATMGRHGEGVAQGPKGPVYVPHTLPGERVRVRLDGKRGRLLEVVEASPDRIAPPCPHFGECGGCALQHWRDAEYRRWKRGLVETALRHRGLAAPVGDLVEAHGAGRRRATLHVRFAGGRPVAGFMAGRSHRLTALDQCPVLAPPLAEAPAIARTLATPLTGRAKAFDISMTATDSGLDCDLRGGLPDSPDFQIALAKLAEELDLARVTLDGFPGLERRPPTLCMGRARVVLPAGGFLQATAAGEETLAALVAEGVGEARRIADLFCGVGPFALRLAEAAKIHAADSDEAAVRALDRAARETVGPLPVTTEVRDLFRRPLTARELARFDAVMFDPPRAGAEAQAGELARSKVPVVISVSCDPASFARDAAILAEGGYRVGIVTPVDQFRWSPHVEIVCVFRRG